MEQTHCKTHRKRHYVRHMDTLKDTVLRQGGRNILWITYLYIWILLTSGEKVKLSLEISKINKTFQVLF